MSFTQLKKKTEGFTIIEVLIVLAIAGLIMLIVFLAVPALQRNQRNNARTNDASRIAAAVTECLANKNGVVTECDDKTKLPAVQLSRMEDFGFGDGSSFTYDQDTAQITYGQQCNDAGTEAVAGGGSRAFSVTFGLEKNAQRCVSS